MRESKIANATDNTFRRIELNSCDFLYRRPEEAITRTGAGARAYREGGWLVLQSGHAADILVRLVGKPTDNPPAQSFCYPSWLTDSPEAISPAVGPGAFPNIPPRA